MTRNFLSLSGLASKYSDRFTAVRSDVESAIFGDGKQIPREKTALEAGVNRAGRTLRQSVYRIITKDSA